MKFRNALAAAAAVTGLAGSAQAADFVSIVQETTLDAPAATAWSRLSGYCDIVKWLGAAGPLTCEVTAGKDLELGTVRRIANAVDEVIVARTPMSYTYADTKPTILYHGTLEVRPLDTKTSKLIYSLFYDQTPIPADQREANKTSRADLFVGVMAAMKAHAEAK